VQDVEELLLKLWLRSDAGGEYKTLVGGSAVVVYDVLSGVMSSSIMSVVRVAGARLSSEQSGLFLLALWALSLCESRAVGYLFATCTLMTDLRLWT
jgi:hypothetical protein